MVEQSGPNRHDRAIVIGGSIAGLAAARALSGTFREVIVIERDGFNRDAAEHRAGTPQSWHIHSLIMRGQQALDALFPGFCASALARGAVRVDQAGDLIMFGRDGWWPRYQSGICSLFATRALLEFVLREQFVAQTANAILLDNTRVLDLITSAQGNCLRAGGVLTNHPTRSRLEADLVVDCTGRSARWKEWFKARGVPLPRETVVDARCGYSSRLYRPRDANAFSWKAMAIDSAVPDQPRFGAILPVEDGQWLVTLGCFDGVYPPTDDAGFLEFARALPTPLLAHALSDAEPLTKLRSSRRHEMRWNHFEAYKQPISHYIALGDSAWAYNPHYAQGMTVAAVSAECLRQVITTNADLRTLPERYYRRAKKFAGQQWESSAQMDLLWATGANARAWYTMLNRPMTDLIARAGQNDRVVSRALIAGAHAITSPLAALSPGVLARIAAFGLKELFLGSQRASEDDATLATGPTLAA